MKTIYNIAAFVILVIVLSFEKTEKVEPVTICYSDTADTDMIGTDENGDEYEFIGKDETVYWQKGFKSEDNFFNIDMDTLPKSVIIWDYKFDK